MKYILITGAAGGMGRAAAEFFSADGYTVLALDKSFSDNCTQNFAQKGIVPITADVTDENSIREAFCTVSEKTENLSAIVHYAGIYYLDSLAEITTEKFDKIFDVNVRGAFLVNKIFLPLLDRGSKILMTTSELAPLAPLPFTGLYAVTKGALDKYAYSLAMELQLLGISVSVLRAGAVATKMLGVSTNALDEFCKNTKLYSCNAKRFRQIVENVEARHIPPEKVALKTAKIINARQPKFAYTINRNPLLLLLNSLPKRLQLGIIKRILKS